MVLVCSHSIMASTIASCQSLNLPSSSTYNSSLFSSSNVFTKSFLNKRSLSVRKHGRLSFNVYASAGENEAHSYIARAGVPTLYDILGLSQDVELHEVKSAFRQLARQHHPDACSSADAAEATARFIKVKEAYDTLSDLDLKAEYDRQLTNPLWPKFAYVKANKNTSTWQTASQHQYRAQWEDQLNGLRQKSHRVDGAMQESRGVSWGSKMRQKMQENYSVDYSEN